MRPSPLTPRSRRDRSPEPDDGLPEGWIEWGGEILYAVGFTPGGAPYGLRVEEFPPDELPAGLEDLADARRAVFEPPARHDDDAGLRASEPGDDHDVPF